ncbi:HAT family dimerization domain-containing protein [Trifolium pratense]|uniref:HAT family dimerization domain-containing protein n=1 Tax=Trifolium pratense TaxID=57577 RepID=A0A2K3NP59_TRIPR|nr:HAT family dimerization domain-containing protein [Trifolium pratense]
MDSQLLDDAVPPTAAATTHHGLPPSGYRRQSHVWMHFTEQVGTQMQAKYNHCPSKIKFKDGTSTMAAHVLGCKHNPDRVAKKRQKTSPTTIPAEGELCVVSSPHVKFDQVKCRLELVKMFVGAELPFRFVENEFFINFVKVLQPRFDIPSCTTLRRAIWSLYNPEFLSNHMPYGKDHC